MLWPGRNAAKSRRCILMFSGNLEALLKLFLIGRLFLRCFNLIRQLILRASREVLNVIPQIVRRRQSLSANGCLAAGEDRT